MVGFNVRRLFVCIPGIQLYIRPLVSFPNVRLEVHHLTRTSTWSERNAYLRGVIDCAHLFPLHGKTIRNI
jgi:hypothetical protein